MPKNIACHKVKELQPDARRIVQELVGRKLREEDQVSIRVIGPHPAPSPAVRRKSAKRLEDLMDNAARKAKDIPAKEIDRLIDEALRHTRARKKR